ncbi:MAG: 1,4-dihydroxy-2-naphthoate octaprenyltransferase [Bacteroidales bacterium]|jgi:1,4-dihydroxy-2-naphthoate octaprenyltransferase|nr:1,4-dihydroxy-2-naphthoate octaprenyltransferase [Bacteroidales bacterium]
MRKIYYGIKALRLFSLPLSLSGIVMGALLANSFGYFSWLLFGLALLTAAALHLTCNLANDVGDYQSGNDSFESIGYETMLISGKLSVREVVIMIGILTAIAVVTGSVFIYLAFKDIFSTGSLIMFLTGLLAVLAAIFYTIGKKPYGYRALGDLAVFLFFGITAVAGTFFLLTKSLPAAIFLPAVSMGFLITGVVNVNNIRDMENDRKYRKTVPILIGERNAKHYHAVLVLLPFILMSVYNILQSKPLPSYLFLCLLPVAVYHVIKVYQKKGLALNKAMGGLILITVLFVFSAI